jgi:hypothetical protein
VTPRLTPRRRLTVAAVAGLALLFVAGFTVVHIAAAASAAQRGKAALSRAEASLSARDLDAARSHLHAATRAFTQTRSEVDGLGLVARVSRRLPLLGDQVKAVDTFASAGIALSEAAQPLVDAAEVIMHPPDDNVPVSAAMDALRSTRASLAPAVAAISQASDQVARLRGRLLLPPLARARDDLAIRLPRIEERAMSADDGLSSLIAFAGGSGPKRYLFLSQNPDEVRPTGGFIGTYGVLTAEGGKLALERYDAIENWPGYATVVVPPEEAGAPFRYSNPPKRRTLANVNSGPDWPEAAQLAANLWRAGGEAPVDGVISFTPGFMGRVLGVVGPVSVPSYGETVTAENIDERLEFQTHQTTPPDGAHRKDFVAVVAETVMQKLLDAPASQWEPLGRAMGQAFDAKQAMAWSADPEVAGSLADRHWDGAFPEHDGDFFFNSEFEYAAKNGRGIRRVYDHHVDLNPDGSARITTNLTVTNTEPPDDFGNRAGTLGYLTIYGPEGAVLDQTASDPLGFKEPAVSGHPATGWFRAAAPSAGQTTLKVVWDAPAIAKQEKADLWRYDLRWLHLPDHTGDVVNLRVDLPAGWRWTSGEPPPQFSLDQEFSGSWALAGP